MLSMVVQNEQNLLHPGEADNSGAFHPCIVLIRPAILHTNNQRSETL